MLSITGFEVVTNLKKYFKTLGSLQVFIDYFLISLPARQAAVVTILVVVKEAILGKVSRQIPSMLDYRIHISKDSMFNTPAVFPVYVSMLTLEWLKNLGGITAIEEINERKAQLLYSEIDLNPVFKGYAKKDDRSLMNATFNLTDDGLRKPLTKCCRMPE